MKTARALLLLLPLLGCDEQHTPGRTTADDLAVLHDTFSCPHDAGEDGYLTTAAPAGLVSVTLWRCYPTDLYGGQFAASCYPDEVERFTSKEEEGVDFVRTICTDGAEIRIDWLTLAD